MNPPEMCKPNLSRLARHLKRIARERNHETAPESLQEVQSYVQKELTSYGFTVEEDPFSWSGRTFSNLVARLQPDLKNRRLIIGAHFDSVPGSPGADDNASGMAALLEAARLYADGDPPSPTVEFAAFNLEEYGMIGSRAYAQKLKREKIEVGGMLSLEMVGYSSPDQNSQKMPFFLKPFYPDAGNFIGLVANTKSGAFLKKVETFFRFVEDLPVESLVLPANGWVFPDARLSDHSPFWDQGYPALLVTDTSFYRNPHYHRESDTIDTLNLNFLQKVAEATALTAILS